MSEPSLFGSRLLAKLAIRSPLFTAILLSCLIVLPPAGILLRCQWPLEMKMITVHWHGGDYEWWTSGPPHIHIHHKMYIPAQDFERKIVTKRVYWPADSSYPEDYVQSELQGYARRYGE